MTDAERAEDKRDLESGKLLPVAKISKKIQGNRVRSETTTRWCRTGICNREIRLAAVKCGNKWHTTKRAFRTFLARRADYSRRPKGDDYADIEASDDVLHDQGLL